MHAEGRKLQGAARSSIKPPREPAQPCKPRARHPPCTQGCSQAPESIRLSPSPGGRHTARSPSPSFKAASVFFFFQPDSCVLNPIFQMDGLRRAEVKRLASRSRREKRWRRGISSLAASSNPVVGTRDSPVQQPVPSRAQVLPHGDDTAGMVPIRRIGTHGCAPNAVPPIGGAGMKRTRRPAGGDRTVPIAPVPSHREGSELGHPRARHQRPGTSREPSPSNNQQLPEQPPEQERPQGRPAAASGARAPTAAPRPGPTAPPLSRSSGS